MAFNLLGVVVLLFSCRSWSETTQLLGPSQGIDQIVGPRCFPGAAESGWSASDVSRRRRRHQSVSTFVCVRLRDDLPVTLPSMKRRLDFTLFVGRSSPPRTRTVLLRKVAVKVCVKFLINDRVLVWISLLFLCINPEVLSVLVQLEDKRAVREANIKSFRTACDSRCGR